MNHFSRKKQQGLSLIELMISITLGLVLMGAAMQVMLSNSKTYRLNDDISRIQENGRIALDLLVKDLRMGGYRKPSNGDGKIPDFFLKECTTSRPNEKPPCAIDGDANNNFNDRLAIQFDPPPDDGTETNCLGELIPATDIVVNVYTIGDLDNNNVNSLYCQGYNASTQQWMSANPQALVDGIDGLQVLYGVAGSQDNPASTTKYVSKNTLVDTDWINVRSVRVGLLVSNGMENGAADVKARSYRLLDRSVEKFIDNHSRRIYTTTVQFNNTSL